MVNDYFSIKDTYNTMLTMFSKDFTINNIIKQGLLKEINDTNSSIDEKYLLTDTELSQGNIIKYNNMNYMIITKNENINNIYNKYTIRKCPYNVNFVIGGIINAIPSIIETKTLDLSSSQYIVLPDGKIVVTIERNDITNTISVNDKFIKMGFPWMITAIDKSLEGLILLHADIQQIGSGDDITNEIPSGASLASYSFTITPSSTTVRKGDTQQLNVSVSRNNTVLTNPNLKYSSSNTNILTVSNSGLITAIEEGTCNITVTCIEEYNSGSTTETATVTPLHNYVLSVSPTSISLDTGSTQQLIPTVTDYGINVENATFSYVSGNTSVATVSNSGLVEAIGAGDTTIMCTFIGEDSQTYTQQIPIGVELAHVYVLSVSPTSISIDNGSTQQLTVSVTDKGVTVSNPTITYSSNNTSIATVNSTGLITATGVGNCNVTCSFVGEDSQTYSQVISTTVNAVVAKTIKFSTNYNGDTEDITNYTDSGNPYKVLQGDTITVTVYAFQTSTQSNDTFTFSFSGVTASYYTKTTPDGNHFTVHNVNGDGGEYLMCQATSNLDSTLNSHICIRLAGEW